MRRNLRRRDSGGIRLSLGYGRPEPATSLKALLEQGTPVAGTQSAGATT